MNNPDLSSIVFARRLRSLLLGALQQLKATLLGRMKQAKSRNRQLVLLESLSLGNRRQLFLVICGDQRFLVGAGANCVGTMVALPECAQVSSDMRATEQPSCEADVRRPIFHANAASKGLQLVKRQDRLRPDARGDGGLREGIVTAHGVAADSVEAGGTRWS